MNNMLYNMLFCYILVYFCNLVVNVGKFVSEINQFYVNIMKILTVFLMVFCELFYRFLVFIKDFDIHSVLNKITLCEGFGYISESVPADNIHQVSINQGYNEK